MRARCFQTVQLIVVCFDICMNMYHEGTCSTAVVHLTILAHRTCNQTPVRIQCSLYAMVKMSRRSIRLTCQGRLRARRSGMYVWTCRFALPLVRQRRHCMKREMQWRN